MACRARPKVASAAGSRSKMPGLAMRDPKPLAAPKPLAPPRAVASLGPLLLARKGTAKPAMRAQLEASSRGQQHALPDTIDELAASQEDLGWNDMGEDVPESATHDLADDLVVAAEPAEPAVRRQQVDLLHRIADANLAAFQAAESQPGPRPVDNSAEQVRRAAFTLRLDEERHLRLRLASTVQGESAQSLVTRALDSLLSQMPEIENLAAQVRPNGRRGGSKA